ncbi:MAG: cell division protein ZapE [Gammaproteobacteria bacterium]|nr:MAG: cell division protein ZapE [Gammaproteobacteria bacterium]
MSIQHAYAAAVKRQGQVEDQAQLRVVDALQKLEDQILGTETLAVRWRRLLPGSSRGRRRGIYLWGGVGRGKTFLMDLFFGSLNIEKKKRIHFHRMMRDIHARLKTLNDVEDPLDRVAADIASETHVLCFDEFFVSDIGDAMILGKLLEQLFDRGVVLVMTSNTRPADLYKDGLQRERFLPTIALLEEHTIVIELDGNTDYRLKLLQEAGTFLTPSGDVANASLMHYFEEIASGETVENHVLDVLGRDLQTQRCAKGVVWFDFMDICDGPRSQEDYIEIARWYPTVIVSDMPVLNRELENPARRFIALVDEFYDRRVKLIVSAATNVDTLYQGNRLQFQFARTASRLTEMQSNDCLHAAHLA